MTRSPSSKRPRNRTRVTVEGATARRRGKTVVTTPLTLRPRLDVHDASYFVLDGSGKVAAITVTQTGCTKGSLALKRSLKPSRR